MSAAHPSLQFISFVAARSPPYPDTIGSRTRQENAVMSSFSRNSRRANSARRTRAVGAGIALTLVSGAALADGAHQFVFTAYSDAAGGAEVLAGRYRIALEELESYRGAVDHDPAATETNLCVAYSMTLQWPKARAACDDAVRAAREQQRFPASWSWAPPSHDDYVALAYANRAVMHWLVHDEAAARKDLARAQELSPQSDFVARNLAALKVHSVVAQAGTPAPKS
jgi:tetratricopeptide (TPR) repeat protein